MCSNLSGKLRRISKVVNTPPIGGISSRLFKSFLIAQVINRKHAKQYTQAVVWKLVLICSGLNFWDKVNSSFFRALPECLLIVLGISSKGIEWVSDQLIKLYKDSKIPKLLMLTKGLSIYNNQYELLVDKLERLLMERKISIENWIMMSVLVELKCMIFFMSLNPTVY
mgnify:CR=1 FL=1